MSLNGGTATDISIRDLLASIVFVCDIHVRNELAVTSVQQVLSAVREG